MVEQESELVEQESGLVEQESGLVEQESGLVEQESELVEQESELVEQESERNHHPLGISRRRVDYLSNFFFRGGWFITKSQAAAACNVICKHQSNCEWVKYYNYYNNKPLNNLINWGVK